MLPRVRSEPTLYQDFLEALDTVGNEWNQGLSPSHRRWRNLLAKGYTLFAAGAGAYGLYERHRRKKPKVTEGVSMKRANPWDSIGHASDAATDAPEHPPPKKRRVFVGTITGGVRKEVRNVKRRKRKRLSLKTLAKTVRKMQKKEPKLSSLTTQLEGGYTWTTTAGLANVNLEHMFVPSTINGYVSALPMASGTAPGTTAVQDLTSAYQQQKIRCDCKWTYTLRNNLTVPCDIRVYHMRCKSSNNNAPLTLVTQGWTEKTTVASASPTSPAITNPLLYPLESQNLKDFWKQADTKIFRLGVGEETTFQFTKRVYFDPDRYDADSALTYHQGMSEILLVRMIGALVHDSTTPSLVNYGATQIDVRAQSSVRVWYEGNDVPAHLKTVTPITDAIASGVISTIDLN